MAKNNNRWVMNNWWKLILAVLLLTSIGGGAAVLKKTIGDMEPKVEANSVAIVENEKAIIKLEVIQQQQSTNHTDVMNKLEEISGKFTND